MSAILASGDAPSCNYTINVHDYTMRYYLVDDIYPPWSTFAKTIQHPNPRKECHLVGAQGACQKDIERDFGVLQDRFAIVRCLSRF
jgi:hypothetical protein